MSELRPPNRNGGRKPNYHSIPVKTKQSSKSGSKNGGKTGGSKYGMPKRQKIPTPVIVTNVLMVCVILAVCGVVFAIAFNNIKYDKEDASKKPADPASSVTVSSDTPGAASSVPEVSSAPEASSVPVSTADTSSEAPMSTSSQGTVAPPVNADFDKEFFKDDLFIGDSIFTGLYLYEYLDRANVAAAVGYTAYGAQAKPFDESYYPGTAVDYAKKRQPKHIIIMLGSNSLSPQTDMDDFVTGNRGLINQLKKECPDSDICVLSVPPITANSSLASYSMITNSIIDNANSRIKSLCGELGVKYYDINSVLKDENGYFSEKYAEADGMHFLGSTYPVLLSGVQKVLEQ